MLENFEFFMIKPVHYDEVIEHLKNNFFYDEPLNRAVGLCSSKGEGHPELEKHSLATLSDGVSVAVQNSKGDIVGVCLNGFLHPGETLKAKEALNASQDEKFQRIFNLLYDQNLKFDLFEELNVDRIFEFRILSVDKNYRGQGLAKKLMQKSENIARKYHCKVVKGDATAAGSLAVCLSLGLKPIAEIHYKETDMNVSPPHEKLVILYKVLDDEK
ncbi:CLUMA_CG012150, isoform A [Clunio marinus]|uniref:aralkylamine N-acetyltransferase n=1 Tax=Clunio marinus TaxID=568069 RepID=A0A1J1IFZ4_9DIPT|nr:CLUMA_CG012150, isoform A [Clunio marinus]